MRIIKKFTDGLISIFFPTTCGVCQRPIKQFNALYVCPSCYESAQPLSGNLCPVCMKPLNSEHAEECKECRQEERVFTRIAASGAYEGALKELIYKLKFYGKKNTAVFLARRVAANAPPGYIAAADVIVPVPATKNVTDGRGYNQTTLVARELARISGREYVEAVKKVKETQQQNKLDRKERLKNLKGAFAPAPGADIKGKKVLVVDDVYTTGATMNEMARALLSAGAAEVRGIVIARSV